MVELRRRISEKLLEAGIELALDRQEMSRRARQRGDVPQTEFLDVMGLLDGLSALAIRLGIVIMPTRPPLGWPEASAHQPLR